MIEKRIFIILCLISLLGCGTASDLGDLSNTNTVEDSKAIVVRGGKEGINYILSTDQRKVRYLGEIENKGTQTFCFIDITFNTKGANGQFIDLLQGVTQAINGFTLTNFGDEIHSCLKPGQTGSFDTGEVVITQDFADFDFRICFRRNGICQAFPLAKDPRVLFVVPDLQLDVDSNGMRIFRGKVKNDAESASNPNAIAYDIRVHFTILNEQGRVIGTAISEILRAQACGANIQAEHPESCLGPQILADFSVNTKIPASQICDGCFYSQIYHSE